MLWIFALTVLFVLASSIIVGLGFRVCNFYKQLFVFSVGAVDVLDVKWDIFVVGPRI